MNDASFAPGDSTLLSLGEDLKSCLQDLLSSELEDVLPRAEQDRVRSIVQVETAAIGSKQGSPGTGKAVEDVSTSGGAGSYVSRSLLVDIARWARHPKSQRALRRAGLDPLDYSLIALCAGARTYTSPAQIRLLEANPLAANPYLPSHLRVASPRDSILPFGLEFRAASRELSAAANVVFSVGGVAGAVWWVSGSSAGFGPEVSILLAILAGLVVLIAEIWLYIANSSRAADARRLEADARRNEPVVGWTGDASSPVEGLDELEKRRQRQAITDASAEVNEDIEAPAEVSAAVLTDEGRDASAQRLAADLEEMLRPISSVETPAADVTAQPAIRLRRRPLGASS